MNARCAECGAALSDGRTCREYFYELLALEAQVPGAQGGEPHFYAVASYNLQHPAGFMPAMLVGLHRTVADVLAGRATVADALRRARTATDGPTRVHRRADAVLSDADRAMLREWPTTWAMTVRDVRAVSAERYAEQVRAWATVVTTALAALHFDRPFT